MEPGSELAQILEGEHQGLMRSAPLARTALKGGEENGFPFGGQNCLKFRPSFHVRRASGCARRVRHELPRARARVCARPCRGRSLPEPIPSAGALRCTTSSAEFLGRAANDTRAACSALDLREQPRRRFADTRVFSRLSICRTGFVVHIARACRHIDAAGRTRGSSS